MVFSTVVQPSPHSILEYFLLPQKEMHYLLVLLISPHPPFPTSTVGSHQLICFFLDISLKCNPVTFFFKYDFFFKAEHSIFKGPPVCSMYHYWISFSWLIFHWLVITLFVYSVLISWWTFGWFSLFKWVFNE